MSRIQVQMIDHSVSSDWWRNPIQQFVRTGGDLEIRCWKEETAEIQQASLYGKPSEDGDEVSTKGRGAAKLLSELFAEEPADKGIYAKRTKCFTINVKNELGDFSSAHDGMEMYINVVSKDHIAFFQRMMGQCS